MRVRRLFLLLWIAGIVLPIGWLSTATPATRQLFDALFAADVAHVAMHLALFAGLALLLAGVLLTERTPGPGRRMLFILAFIAIVFGQEVAQLIWKGRAFGVAEIYDFGIDLTGGLFGAWLFTRWKNRPPLSEASPAPLLETSPDPLLEVSPDEVPVCWGDADAPGADTPDVGCRFARRR